MLAALRYGLALMKVSASSATMQRRSAGSSRLAQGQQGA